MKCQMMSVLSSLLAATHAPVQHTGAHPVAEPLRPAVVQGRYETQASLSPMFVTVASKKTQEEQMPTDTSQSSEME